jgi:hypothetical protein
LGIVGSVKEGHEVEWRGEEDIRDCGRENAEWGLRPEGVRQKEESSRDYEALWVCLLKSHGGGYVQVRQAVLRSRRVESSENLDASDLNSLPSRSRATDQVTHLHPSNKYIIFTEHLRRPFLNSGTTLNIYTQIASPPPVTRIVLFCFP